MFNLFNYLTLACSFYNVFAISPCEVRTVPFKLQSQDIFTAEETPTLQESVTTTVNLSMSINDLSIIDIKTLDVEIDLGMTQKWYDHRLAPDYKTRKLAVLGAIWQPKITFIVGNKCPDITASGNNDQTQFWRGTSNGSVFYSERVLVKPKCTKDLTKYPFDSQTCFIKIGSYRFTAEEVSLEWSSESKPIELRVDKELGEFRMEKLNTYSEIDVRSAGNFSVLVLEIHLSRYCRREVIQSFIPSVILVEIAYGVFWIKLSAIRVRILTCQFSLAGTLFLFTKSNYGVSNSTYLKALDVWFLVCIVFVLLPLAESVFIHYIHPLEENFYCSETETETEYNEIKSGKKIAVWIDKILSILHPIGLTISSAVIFFTLHFSNEGNDWD